MTAVRTSRPLGQLGRGLLSVGGMFTNFSALTRLPLADATAISFASPLITVALAAIILKERVRIYRWSAVLIGFGGVIVMLIPHLDIGPLRGDRRRGCGGRLDVCRHLGLLQRGNGHPDPAADAERNDVIDRVLFLAGLRHCRRADAALRLAFADAARARRADRARYPRRLCAHFADRELPLCHSLAGRALRLHVDALGAACSVTGCSGNCPTRWSMLAPVSSLPPGCS
jgi:hypothetical protein